AEAAGVVDHDQVGAALLDTLGGEPGTGTGADDGRAARDLGAQPLENSLPAVVNDRVGHVRISVLPAMSSTSRLAIASANCGSLTFCCRSCNSTLSPRFASNASISAASASASWKGPPG